MNAVINCKTEFIDLGLVDYKKAWDYQTELFEKILATKKYNRAHPETPEVTANYLIFCEHPHVYTLGQSGKADHLLIDEKTLSNIDASYYQINRGGDITYHGPGQIVGYPVIDLENFFTDIHRYMRSLEEAVISTLAHYGVEGGRIPGLTGVWIDPDNDLKARKICAFGVKSSRWVMLHGFAFNVNTDLSYFKHIVPCGIQDKAVTSLQQETGHAVDLAEVADILRGKIADEFGMEII